MQRLLLLLACQEPFEADRHLLADDRITALSAEVDGDLAPRHPYCYTTEGHGHPMPHR